GVARQTGIVYGDNPRVRRQKLGERLSVGILARKSGRESLEAADKEIGSKRVYDGTGYRLQAPNPVHDFARPENRAGEKVVVPAEILGGGMQDEINAEFYRPLIKGRSESGIDDRF